MKRLFWFIGLSICVGLLLATSVKLGTDLEIRGSEKIIWTSRAHDTLTLDTIAYIDSTGVYISRAEFVGTTINTDTTYYGIYNYHIKTDGATGIGDFLYGIYNYINMFDADQTMGNLLGIRNTTVLDSGIVGVGGTARNVYGLYNDVLLNDAIINGDAYAAFFQVDQAVEDSVTSDICGVKITVDADGKVDGDVYLLYLDDSSNVDYAIYQTGTAPSELHSVTIDSLLSIGYKIILDDMDFRRSAGGVGWVTITIQPNTGNKDAVFQFAPSGNADASVMEFYESSALTSTSRVIFKIQSGIFQIGGDNAKKPIQFIQDNVAKVTIDTLGYVGIGTNTPVYHLDVNGIAKNRSVHIFALGYHLGADSIVVENGDTIASPTIGMTFVDTSGGDTLKCYLNSAWEIK